jgi:ATP-dependent Clp protease ATP-binding subunit ClpA
MTSNLGAVEMGSILNPSLGFGAAETERARRGGTLNDDTSHKISRAAVEAARRKFTPEFMNRIDKTVVFRPLGEAELRRILDLELNVLQQRIFNSAAAAPFVFSVAEAGKDFLLREGADLKYGARHLKRAIDRSLVQPLSNLVATQQVRGGDLVKIDFDHAAERMTFCREAENMPSYVMMQALENARNGGANIAPTASGDALRAARRA